MSTQHTPGHWEWDSTVWDYDPEQDAPWLVYKATGDLVLSGEIKCNSEANARLIAAAPELFDALCTLMDECGIESADALAAWDKARAAIAQALGEKNDHT